MEQTNVWAKRAHSRDTRDSGDMKSERKNMGDDDPCQSRISSVLVLFRDTHWLHVYASF